MKYTILEKIYYKDKKEYESLFLSRFSSESTLHFDFDVFGNKAFTVINNDILNLVSDIYEKNSQLSNITDNLPEIALFQYTKTCLVDEIRITNDIEGVYSTRKEINALIHDENTKDLKGLRGIVKKYKLMLSEKESLNLHTCEDVRKLYDELVIEEVVTTNKDNMPDGKCFRAQDVHVVSKKNKLIHSGVTPETKISELINQGLKIIYDDDINFFIRVSVFHYLFGYVHPFYDGNGRLSRFISSYLLSYRLDPMISYRLSCSIKENIDKYYKAFKITNDKKNKGELTYFVIAFLEFILNSIDMLIKSLNDRLDKYNYYGRVANELIGIYDLDETKYKLLNILVQNEMFGDEPLGINELADSINMGRATTNLRLKELQEYGFITEIKEGKKKLYGIDLEAFEKNAEN